MAVWMLWQTPSRVPPAWSSTSRPTPSTVWTKAPPPALHLGGFGVVFIAATLALFSFSTFLGVLYYARGNVAYLCGDNWWSQTVYKLIALAMLVIGGMQAYTVVWDLGDVGIGLMTIFNMIALVPMAKEALAALNDYEKRKKLQ